jgi:acyl-coenzyme A thioesterase PaaI-like protein
VPESRESARLRRRLNRYPAYRATGGRITYVADDLKEIRVAVRLSWLTRNLYGTLFGGSLYGAVDPIYAVMLMHLLGSDYVIWDKAAAIRFRKPGRSTLTARFRIDETEVDAIRAAVAADGKTDRLYRLELVDVDGVVHAEIEKTIYVARDR